MRSDIEKNLLDFMDEGDLGEIDPDKEGLFQVGRQLMDVDIEVSKEAKKIAYDRMMENLKEERKIMDNKRNILLKRVASIGLVAAMGIGAVQTGFAQDMYDRVKNIISLDYVTMEEELEVVDMDHQVPDILRGKIFDENGKELTEIYEGVVIYDGEGFEVDHIDIGENGRVFLERVGDKEVKNFDIFDIEEAKQLLKFKLQVPTKLPEGYEFKRVSFYGEGKDDIGGEYATLIYGKGDQEFYISQRLASDENAFEGGGIGLEEISINGRRAIVDKKGNIDIEIDDAIVSLLTLKNISKAQAIKVITSIK